ncbi:MAG: CCA tRNA nucleotidyltransferase [Verrucomicrobia bacterium]|nr:CCA tRNA nucleotidyltransferase [Verrucomicrobiota bacterium]
MIVRRLRDAGFEAFWVGGCVRDRLLGREPTDYDIATNARPEQVEQLFAKTVPVGRQFGVVLVVEDGFQFQVATFRAEAHYADGRHPGHVEFADARADALRRDFTVNGLFYDPVGQEVHDWVGGEADLKARVVRTIGEPGERFAEDHLRLLRAVRLAAQLGFQIERRTFEAMGTLAPKLRVISAERIRDELLKLFQPPHAARGLELLRDTGLLREILPELHATIGCEQSPPYHPEGDVFRHLVLMLEQLPGDPDPRLPWAVLLHDIAKPVTASRDPDSGAIRFYEHERVGETMTQEILARLRFPRKQIDEVAFVVRHHMQFKDALDMRQSTLRRMLLRPTFPLELELHRLDCLGSHGRLDIYQFLVQQAGELAKKPEVIPPLLTGDDLLALGLKPGPEVGRWLADIRDLQLQETLTDREQALAWARSRLAST